MNIKAITMLAPKGTENVTVVCNKCGQVYRNQPYFSWLQYKLRTSRGEPTGWRCGCGCTTKFEQVNGN